MASSPRLEIGQQHCWLGLNMLMLVCNKYGRGVDTWTLAPPDTDTGPVKVPHSQEPIVMIAATRLYAILNMLLNKIVHFEEHSTFRYEQG